MYATADKMKAKNDRDAQVRKDIQTGLSGATQKPDNTRVKR